MTGAEHGLPASQPRRPLPLPADTHYPSRRALPTPPAIPGSEVPQSRSRRALPPVPNAIAPPPRSEQSHSSYTASKLEEPRPQPPSRPMNDVTYTPLSAVRPEMNINRDYQERPVPSREEVTNGFDREEYLNGRETPTQANWSTKELAGPAYRNLEQSNHYHDSNGVPHVRHAGPSTGQDSTPTMPKVNGLPDSSHISTAYNAERQSFESVAFPEPHPRRQPSTRSSLQPSNSSMNRSTIELSPSWNDQSQPPSAWVERKLQIHQSHRADLYDDESVFNPESQYEDEDDWDEEEDVEVDESRFFNRALLSEMAVQVKDKVVMGRHTKAGIAWVGSFTGRDVVVSHVFVCDASKLKLVDQYPRSLADIHTRFSSGSPIRLVQRAFFAESAMVCRSRLGH